MFGSPPPPGTPPPAIKGRGAAEDPPNRFLSTWVEPDPEWNDPEDPGPRTRFLPDATRSVISWNDSPDIPFRASLNPYRGCEHGCSYCLAGETRVLLANGRSRPIADLRPGDRIVGTRRAGLYRRYVATRVLDHWQTRRAAWRVTLADGTELIASGDHRFLTERGWKHVRDGCDRQRPHLTLNNKLMGFGLTPEASVHGEEYRRGYLCGMIRGDGVLRVYRYSRPGRAHDNQCVFRLALLDGEALTRTEQFLRESGVATTRFTFQAGHGRTMPAIGTRASASFARIEELVRWPSHATEPWSAGFLAGIFDAEGSHDSKALRIHNTDPTLLDATQDCLRRLGHTSVLEWRPDRASAVRVTGGIVAHQRLFHRTDPAITRKRAVAGIRLKCAARLQVVGIEPLGRELPMFDISTGTGDFVANGVVSHNCYARPTHEYLGLSAGLDFETRIVVKERAPELLRAQLAAKSWEPQPLALSGVTDAWQPIERRRRLTRACLEVLAEARNPVVAITKSALITRDLDLLGELAAHRAAAVNLSITSLDDDLAGRLEPRAARPRRRLEAIAALAQAGIPVGVMVAPVIPGLNDREVPAILEAARAAGARSAAMILLRLPHGLEELFPAWLERHLPARKEKVLARLREARGGRLNDPRFGVRMRGEGAYAAQIQALFQLHRRRLGFVPLPELSTAAFRPPEARRDPRQRALFGPS